MDFLPYLIVFLSTLAVTLILTPIVREMNRRLGMVDKPDPRRINKVPIPRGGGLALVIGTLVPYLVFHFVTGRPLMSGVSDEIFLKMTALSLVTALIGLIDDRFSLPPRLKLLGQVIVAFLVWVWADLGFSDLWPSLPAWLDCLLTVFWIVGAINAFNLIDGLDGLASGIALIAAIGMAGSVFILRNGQATLFYFAFIGALLGFLRYNYNPASVFLGDCGSMYIGFVIGTLPLAAHTPNSLLVSVGVPMLAMGVPIFDTALAILRRSLRHLIYRGNAKAGKVMSADTDHLHHRLLRATGLNQRKTAWLLYALAFSLICIGLVAMMLESRSAGLWLAAVAFAAVIIFKDAKIELFDVGVLLNEAAHAEGRTARRRLSVLSVPFYVIFDLLMLAAAFVLCSAAFNITLDRQFFRFFVLVRVVCSFTALAFFNTYRTVWARAQLSNYVRVFTACMLGAVMSSVIIYYWPSYRGMLEHIAAMTLAYAVVSFVFLVAVRVIRSFVRDLFYALDCSRLKARKDVSRVLVYGAGLRYRAYRRELVRTTSANDRIIVGLIDDDVYLKGRYIGGLKVHGTINDAPEVINALNADTVVIACTLSDEWLKVVKDLLRPTGVKIRIFNFSETEITY